MNRSDSSLQLQLRDGSRLGYARWGAPGNEWVFYFHGVPGSRLGADLAREAAQQLELSVVAVDRPGYGLSTPAPGLTLREWPARVAELADALGLKTFYVVGVSGGGPWALSCAHQLAERVQATAIVSGMGLPTAAALRQMPRLNRILLFQARRLTWLLRLQAPLLHRLLARHPRLLVQALARHAPPADLRILARPGIRALLETDMREALSEGPAGLMMDACALVSDWGPLLEGNPARIDLWHGEADPIVPIASARALAERLDHCRTFFLPGEGHLMVVDRLCEIVEQLRRH